MKRRAFLTMYRTRRRFRWHRPVQRVLLRQMSRLGNWVRHISVEDGIRQWKCWSADVFVTVRNMIVETRHTREFRMFAVFAIRRLALLTFCLWARVVQLWPRVEDEGCGANPIRGMNHTQSNQATAAREEPFAPRRSSFLCNRRGLQNGVHE
jgi:hypothetical protein